MNICEICGTANNEQDTQCRVCGHVLSPAVVQQPEPVVANNIPTQESAEPMAPPDHGNQHAVDAPWNLQMTSVPEQAPTGAPPMLGNKPRQEATEPNTVPRESLPGFMQPGARANTGSQEAVELISANDLPNWIRQIAEADAAKEKAEAEAAQSAAGADAPASLVKRALPGETRASGPPTSWLSKSSASQEPSEHWASEETAAANWGATDTNASPSAQPAYPVVNPGPAYVPSTYEQTGDSSKRRIFGRGASSNTAGGPIYRNRVVQLAVLILLVVLLAAMLV